MANQNDQEHASFYDQADGRFNEAIEKRKVLDKKTASTSASESDFSDEAVPDPDKQVRETEDASLQDSTYSFDESNTDNEEYHDASGAEEIDYDNDDDFVQ